MAQIKRNSFTTLQFQIIGGPTDNLNIKKQWGPNKKRGNRFSLIMGIASAKSQSTRGTSQQPAFMGRCLNINPQVLVLSCVCLFCKKNERVYILG